MIIRTIAIAFGATLAMDLWNLFVKRAFGVPSLNYCLLGRWVAGMPSGTFKHTSIAAAVPRRLECPLGWATHYTIGIGLTIGFVSLVGTGWLVRPTLLPAVLYGIATIVFPFFIMQPALGLGIASARTRNPSQARLKSLATHLIFGLALYGCAVAVSYGRAAY